MTEHLAFYLENDVSPVNQDIQNLNTHFERREALYRFLGITRNSLHKKTIREVGPGSGQNSLYLATCLPSKLSLIEPNPVGKNQILQNYANCKIKHTKPEIKNINFKSFECKEKVDFSIAECFLGDTEIGIELIKKLEKTTKQNGTVVLTATPCIGLLANSLRAALAYRLIEGKSEMFDTDTETLLESFTTHLDTLPFMSRFQRDWIQDNLLNPAALSEIIHPIQLIQVLNNSSLLASYPTIFEGWNWYKSFCGNSNQFSQQWINQYNLKAHNLLDTNTVASDRNESDNIELEHFCKSANDKILELRNHKIPDVELVTIVKKISSLIPGSHQHIIKCIDEWIKCYEKININADDVKNLHYFKNWFGRELLYMSFTKK